MRTWEEILHDPRIDDSGEYDYLVEELPQDNTRWIHGYETRCGCCGKRTKHYQISTHYFYCYDGWDSMSFDECWKCILKRKIRYYLHKIFNRRKHK